LTINSRLLQYQDMAGQKTTQEVGRRRRDHLLASAVGLLVDIANLRTPNEIQEFTSFRDYLAKRQDHDGIPEQDRVTFFRLLRETTRAYWPELWEPADQNEPASKTEWRALDVVICMRKYLRLFWQETDPRARNWYIYRAREYYQRRFVLPQTSDSRQAFEGASTADEARVSAISLNVDIERMLDQPPKRNWIENALFELQQRAHYPSKSPRFCPNPDCETPYFLSEKKGQKFCTTTCSHESQTRTKLSSFHKNKNIWPSTANRRKHG
jgi:hypothetical protein